MDAEKTFREKQNSQLLRLEEIEKAIKRKTGINSFIPRHQKICLQMLEIIRKNPEYNNKLKSFTENQVFGTSRKDEIFFIEVGRLKQGD